jgi:hypothetical protein
MVLIFCRRTWDHSQATKCELHSHRPPVAPGGRRWITQGQLSRGPFSKVGRQVLPTHDVTTALAAFDPAHIVDKLGKYVDVQTTEIEVAETKKAGSMGLIWKIPANDPPLVFVNPGTYEVLDKSGKKQQRTSFGHGTLYFRHGAKSEPARQEVLWRCVPKQADHCRTTSSRSSMRT